jgi:hypothetical protein
VRRGAPLDDLGILEVMMSAIRASYGVALASLLGACAGALPKANTSVFPDGTYQFYEHAAGVTTEFAGRIQVAGDSVKLVESTPECIEEPLHTTDPYHAQAFRCGDFRVTATRRSDRWTFAYATQRTIQDEVQTCAIYETIAGRQVCTKTHVERRERVVPVTGTLRLTRLDASASGRSGVP